jgi:hypothetical protein
MRHSESVHRGSSAGENLARGLELARFIPERELDAIPQSQLVVNGAKIILNDVLGGANGFRYLTVFETLGDQLYDAIFSCGRDCASFSVPQHEVLRTEAARVISLLQNAIDWK